MDTNRTSQVVDNDEPEIVVDGSTKVSFMMQIPLDLKNLLIAAAEERNISTSACARQILAEAVDYTLPASSGRSRKYANADERKAAQKTRNKARRELVKKLLAEYNAQSEDDEDEDEDE